MRRLFLPILLTVLACRVCAGECAWCSDLSLNRGGQIKPTKMNFFWSQGEAETNKVDLLFAFDSAASQWLETNGWDQASFSDEVIFEMNSSLALTELDNCFTFRRAGCYGIDADLSDLKISKLYNYSSGMVKKEAYEPYFLPLRQYREEVKADIVVVFSVPQDTSYYGVSLGLTSDYLTKTGIVEYAEYAYCAVDVRAAFDRFCVLHEVGHVFGAGHEDTQRSSPGPQLFSYSSGYKFNVGNLEYVTVMGYLTMDSYGNFKNAYLPCFSSPDYLFNGVPVGTSNKNDNTRTLRETYPLVANFRVAKSVSETDNSISLVVRERGGSPINDGNVVALKQYVNVAFDVAAESQTGEKVTVKVTGLPSGLKYSAKAGGISGYAKKAGTFSVTVKATARGKSAVVRKFVIDVGEMPASLIGTYIGIISNAINGATLAKATVVKGGKVSLTFKYNGTTKTFSTTGFGYDAGEWIAQVSAHIKSQTCMFTLRLGERSATVDECSGILLQNVWGRKDITAPVFKRAVTANVGGLTAKMSGKGKVRITGVVDEKKVSGSFQLVAGVPSQGYAKGKWSVPVAFAAKRNFTGWVGWLEVDLVTDGANRVTGGQVRMAGE